MYSFPNLNQSIVLCLVWPSSIHINICIHTHTHIFRYMAKKMLYISNHIFFIHSSIDRHLDCFHNLPIANNAAIGVRDLFEWCFFQIYPVVKLLGYMLVLLLDFFEKPPYCFHNVYTNLHSYQKCIILSSPHLHQHLIFVLLLLLF